MGLLTVWCHVCLSASIEALSCLLGAAVPIAALLIDGNEDHDLTDASLLGFKATRLQLRCAEW